MQRLRLSALCSLDPARENEPLKGPNANSNVIPKTELEQPVEGAITRPQSGLSTFVGQGVDAVLDQYGEPARKEPSSFGYDWWVYNTSVATFFMLGVQNEYCDTSIHSRR